MSLNQVIDRNTVVTIHVIHSLNVSQIDDSLLPSVNLPYIRLVYRDISTTATLSRVFISRHLTKATYFRLYLARVLPKDISRVLYIDCDCLFVKGPEELFSTELSGFTIGAVEDYYFVDRRFPQTHPNFKSPYFNAGLLLIDLPQWRTRKIEDRLLEMIMNNQFDFHDQDALNIVLENDWLPLSLNWNVQCVYAYSSREWVFSRRVRNISILGAFANPFIVHFTGPSKPWAMGSRLYGAHLYHRFRHAEIPAGDLTANISTKARRFIRANQGYIDSTVGLFAPDRLKDLFHWSRNDKYFVIPPFFKLSLFALLLLSWVAMYIKIARKYFRRAKRFDLNVPMFNIRHIENKTQINLYSQFTDTTE